MQPVLFIIVLLESAHAGEHRELCPKIEAAVAVVEIQFEQKAIWTTEYKNKSWPPPASELAKTARTGVVVEVFKGELDAGVSWEEAWGVNFTISGMEDWKHFMGLEKFSQIWFMNGSGGTTGWAEESAGCGSSDQDSILG